MIKRINKVSLKKLQMSINNYTIKALWGQDTYLQVSFGSAKPVLK
jgi:hypothetical protein